MQTIVSADLLHLWEASGGQTFIERSLMLLAKAWPTKTVASIAMLSIGERDEMLLLLREQLFGIRLKNTSACPKCDEIVEWENDTKQMHLQLLPNFPSAGVRSFIKGDISLNYRLPNSNDLLNITRNPGRYLADPGQLLTDCIFNIRQDKESIKAADLNEAVLRDIETQIGDDDPQADIGILLSCPSCKNKWEVKFDILTYLWAEIDVWATHLLHEIYLLASAFGWAEADILNLSRHRRAMYVKLIQA
jgi:hypothetical protein